MHEYRFPENLSSLIINFSGKRSPSALTGNFLELWTSSMVFKRKTQCVKYLPGYSSPVLNRTRQDVIHQHRVCESRYLSAQSHPEPDDGARRTSRSPPSLCWAPAVNWKPPYRIRVPLCFLSWTLLFDLPFLNFSMVALFDGTIRAFLLSASVYQQ